MSADVKSFDLKTNSLNQFFKEMYVDQSGEFVFGYWGFRAGYFTVIRYFEEGPLEPGAPFSKVPVTFRARNQMFKSKYKEEERGSWLANYSILFH